MGQIVKKKKKGRPAKADLAAAARDMPQTDRDLRRSHRRRSVKYVFDLDDYFDEDEVFVDDEDQRRREKKLKLLLKLQSGGDPESTDRRVQHASCSSDEDAGKPSKKRRIDEEMDEDLDEGNDDANEEEIYNDEDEEEVIISL